MPIRYCTTRVDSARLDAWRAHYTAKGCSDLKARQLARRKRFGASWPERTN